LGKDNTTYISTNLDRIVTPHGWMKEMPFAPFIHDIPSTYLFSVCALATASTKAAARSHIHILIFQIFRVHRKIHRVAITTKHICKSRLILPK
jgi:hypothetical protein